MGGFLNTITQPSGERRLPWWPGLLAASICLAAVIYLRLHSQSDGELGVAELLLISAPWMLSCAVLWWLTTQGRAQLSLFLVLGIAVLLRLLALGAAPVLEDDGYRFLWDGRQVHEQSSPYLTAPAEHFDDDISEHWQSILGQINNPNVGTVYGPTAQYAFGLAYWIAPGEFWALQLILISFDLLLIVLLSRLTSVANLMLYAWSPLIVKEFAFSMHPDVIGVFFLVTAFWFRQQSKFIGAGIALGLALGVKVFAVITVPLILLRHRRAWLSMAICCWLIALPFGVVSAWLPDGLKAMSGEWTFNAPVYLSLLGVVPLTYVKIVLGSLFSVIALLTYWRAINAGEQETRQLASSLCWLFGILFLCAPVVNPWYLVWLLAFAAIRPTLWAWVASWVVLLAYISGINLADSGLSLYQQPLWLVWFQFCAVLTAGLLPMLLRRRQPQLAP